ncbi:MAG: FAD:protein FMN transferase [Pseudolabrys sp.]|nr:FAD:protein FMN transferase [Pseudolabrys sp.]
MALPTAAASPRRVLIPLDIARPPPRPAAMRVLRLGGKAMGTSWSVTLAAATAGALTPLRHAIEAALDRVVAQMSTWRSDSAICAFNAAAPNSWHRLPDDFAAVLDSALVVAEASGGAYDPAIGALVDLWGFGPQGRKIETPSDAAIATALAQAGWQRLRRDGRTRFRQPGGLQLDLSSIAKGFAVDQVAACLNRHGVENYLAEIGGELIGRGVKPDGTPWWVALEHPGYDDAYADTIVALHGLAIATSGDQQRFIERGGARLPHVLDPRNGRPVQNGTASVTVLHRQCMLADAWATALMVPAPHDAMALATVQNLAARLLVRNDTGWDELMTPTFAAMLD